jgi:hypothetical protein
MNDTRRKFMIGLAAGSILAIGADLLFGQRHMPRPNLKQQPNFPQNSIADQLGKAVDPKAAKAAVLLQNEQEFRESVERLSVLVNELKEEVEKTAATDVLSVRTYKKAQEIEKLAKQIKTKAKG